MLAPAIAYARDGFPLVPRISQAILAVQALFRDEWTSSAEVWLRNGRAPAPDALFRTPGIAATYTRIVEQAQAAGRDRRGRIEAALHIWHEGFVADEIDAYYTHAAVRDTTGQRNRGLLRKSDLAQWRPGYDEPATVQYGRYTVAKCGPWSQGPCICNNWPSCATWAWTGWTRNHRSSCIASPKPPSSPSPTAPPGTAIPPSWSTLAGAAERALRAHARGADQ